MASLFSSSKAPVPMEGGGPRLDLSGPILKRAFETLVAGTEDQGGVEQWIDALKLKSRMIQQAFGQCHPADLPLDTFKSLCAFMASVRRRVGPYLEKPAWDDMVAALAELLDREQVERSVDERLETFCAHFPQDGKHRWVRDLAAEILHERARDLFIGIHRVLVQAGLDRLRRVRLAAPRGPYSTARTISPVS